jgi:HemK-related putative methylase
MIRRLWRFGLRWRYRLLQRHRHRHLVIEWVDDVPLLVLPDVFNPVLFRTGPFLAEQLDGLPPGQSVLDMGTGSGLCGVLAARRGHQVTAVDINPAAVRCAQINALLNEVADRMQVHHGDLFAPLEGQRFDVVLFNPPFYLGSARDDYDHAWRAEDTVQRFARQLPAHLTADGYALVVLSTDGDTPTFLRQFADAGLQTNVVAERDLINEVMTVYRLQPRTDPKHNYPATHEPSRREA